MESEDDDVIIRSKWALDGCATLDEVIARLGNVVAYYEKLKEDGWELTAPIDDDYGFIKKKEPVPGPVPGPAL